ncbi:MAG: hypothetical protein F4X80_10675 [Chloroflexi bacterium]|nr:hypothetical protein [Chloroflexota bacterium]
MAVSALREAPDLIERVKCAMVRAHEDWETNGRATRSLKSHLWMLGFELADECGVPLYPFANGLSAQAGEDHARRRLEERGAHFWGRTEEHSVLREFTYDVAWAELDDEYESDARVPGFRRLVLALESELQNEWEVLFDFHKLLSARADLRVMVWDLNRLDNGFDLLDARLRQADGWDDGYWLLSGWGRDGFEHVDYHDGKRQN